MSKEKIDGSINWELIEKLHNDKDLQSAKLILKKCIEYESKIYILIDKREKELRDIFVKYYKQYTAQDIQ